MDAIAEFEATPSPVTAFGALRATLMQPRLTFSTLPLNGPWVPAVMIAVLIGLLIWTDEVRSMRSSLDSLRAVPQFGEALSSPVVKKMLGSLAEMDPDSAWTYVWMAGVPTVPIGLLLSIVSVHLCLLICKAGEGGLTETTRVMAYSAGGGLLSLIPLVGGLVSLVLVSIQLVCGLTYVHRTTTGRVLLALSVPVILLCVVAILGLIAIVARR